MRERKFITFSLFERFLAMSGDRPECDEPSADQRFAQAVGQVLATAAKPTARCAASPRSHANEEAAIVGVSPAKPLKSA